mgnify:CR=1 FL=1
MPISITASSAETRNGGCATRTTSPQPHVHAVVGGVEGDTFDISGDDADLAALLQRLVADGIPVHEFRHVEADLEEIFLRATEGTLQ